MVDEVDIADVLVKLIFKETVRNMRLVKAKDDVEKIRKPFIVRNSNGRESTKEQGKKK